jgi:hypothetical protein
MRWFSFSSQDSFVRRAACSLSLLALIGSSSVSAQLNNETSPTHQFKSVSYLHFEQALGVYINNAEAGQQIREVDTGELQLLYTDVFAL